MLLPILECTVKPATGVLLVTCSFFAKVSKMTIEQFTQNA